VYAPSSGCRYGDIPSAALQLKVFFIFFLNDPGSKSQVIRLGPDGPLLLAFNDHKPGSLRGANNTDVPVRGPYLSIQTARKKMVQQPDPRGGSIG
jgi:hypothetical protein